MEFIKDNLKQVMFEIEKGILNKEPNLLEKVTALLNEKEIVISDSNDLPVFKKFGFVKPINEIYKIEFLNVLRKLHKKTFEKKDGLFICFTGVDKCGKDTQIVGSDKFPEVIPIVRFLEKHFNEILIIDLPTYDTPLGMIVGGILNSPKVKVNLKPLDLKEFLYLAFVLDRAQHQEEVIEVLNNNGCVIANRWKESNVAYQPVITSKTMGFFMKLEKNLIGPDVTFLIDISAEEVMKRIKKANIRADLMEKLQIQKKVRENYLALSKNPKWITINGEKTPKEVNIDIINHLRTILEKR